MTRTSDATANATPNSTTPAAAAATAAATTAAMIESQLPTLRALAGRVRRLTGARVPMEELVSAGVVGLCEAMRRFDPDRGTALMAFAYPRIRGAMVDAVASAAPVPRTSYRHRRVFVGRLKTPDEVVDPTVTEPHHELDRERALSRVHRAMDRLPGRHRQLLQRHYVDGVDLSAAGRELGISKSWASRLHRRALEQLRADVAQAG